MLNDDFLHHEFYGPEGMKLAKSNEEIIRQFLQITGIQERRYVTDDLVTSDIAYFAAKSTLESWGIDAETLDYIIVAHNFGDIRKDNRRSEFVPALASRVKHRLQIHNPATVAYDLPFGCPGWLQAVIQADYFIRSGDAKRALVIGAETLSRVADPHDRDSMIYADGAGAVVLEGMECERPQGILAHVTKTYTTEDLAYVLKMDLSNNPAYTEKDLFVTMQGRVLYENALKIVPKAIKESLDKAGLTIRDVDKVLIHQANNKMDEAILQRLFKEYGLSEVPEDIMPMTISWLGNSSVATLPTLYDLLIRGLLDNHSVHPGNLLVFASVGAGIHVNSVIYRVPADPA